MNLKPYISQIELEDMYDSESYGTTTLYFTAPKVILDGKYPEAECATISLEFPRGTPEFSCVSACCSPTKYDPEEDAYSDYDWFDISLSYGDIEKLLRLYKIVKE